MGQAVNENQQKFNSEQWLKLSLLNIFSFVDASFLTVALCYNPCYHKNKEWRDYFSHSRYFWSLRYYLIRLFVEINIIYALFLKSFCPCEHMVAWTSYKRLSNSCQTNTTWWSLSVLMKSRVNRARMDAKTLEPVKLMCRWLSDGGQWVAGLVFKA